MNFIGLDLSLNGTGIVILNENKKVITQELIKSNPKDQIEPRLLGIRKNIIDFINNEIKYACIEGLAYAVSGSTQG